MSYQLGYRHYIQTNDQLSPPKQIICCKKSSGSSHPTDLFPLAELGCEDRSLKAENSYQPSRRRKNYQCIKIPQDHVGPMTIKPFQKPQIDISSSLSFPSLLQLEDQCFSDIGSEVRSEEWESLSLISPQQSRDQDKKQNLDSPIEIQSLLPLETITKGQIVKEFVSTSAFDQNEASKPAPDRRPLVSIVGRPNVGKSTLFNRLIPKNNKSLVSSSAGTTRDRKYALTDWDDYPILFVDTGGILGNDEWSQSIQAQALIAVEEADIIVMIVDAQDGLLAQDRSLAQRLRKTSKPVFLVINKCDQLHQSQDKDQYRHFLQLGMGQPFHISAAHGLGIVELGDAILAQVQSLGFSRNISSQPSCDHPLTQDKLSTIGAFHADGSRKEIRVSLIGVPNVGKSSLMNCMLKSQRSIVCHLPGTTTDPVNETFMWKNAYPIKLVDTAGIRKKKSQIGDIERLASLWALKTIEQSHVCVLLLDASLGAHQQDLRLSSYIINNYRSTLVVINKWDLAPDPSLLGMQIYEEELRQHCQFWSFIPIVFASAKTGYNLESIMSWIIKISDERTVKLMTRKLFQILEQATLIRSLPRKGNKQLRFRYGTQVNWGGSPTFVFFVNHPELVSANYERFLEAMIRQPFPFTGTPIRIMFRKNEGRKKMQRSPSKKDKFIQ